MSSRPAVASGAFVAALALCIACSDLSPRQMPAAVTAELARTGSARLIVMLNRIPSHAERTRLLSLPGLRVERWLAHAVAVRATAGALAALQQQPFVGAVALDLGGEGHLLQSLPLAGFPAAQAFGYRGAGITVAVLDTGVDRSHPDLAGAVVDEACFCTGCCAGGMNEAHGEGSAADDNGHGTHVAGIIASRGIAVAPAGGAPASELIAVKVLNSGNGFCCTTDIAAALEWLASAHPEVDVVNMSLGTSALFDGDCDAANPAVSVLTSAIAALRAQGVVVVASSGNQGSSSSMNAPACIQSSLSVGAVWDEDVGAESILCQELMTSPDRIACFSNASSTLDVLAPGARVTSTSPMGLIDGRVGTSQAAPIVSACAALLREAVPDASVADIEGALRTSPTSLLDARNALAYPRLDCGAALSELSSTQPFDASMPTDASLDSGFDAGDSGAIATPDAGSAPQDASLDGDSDAAGGDLDADPAPSDGSISDAAISDAANSDAADLPAQDDADATGPMTQRSDASTTRPSAADCSCHAVGASQRRAFGSGALGALLLGTLRLRRRRGRSRCGR